MTERRLGEVEAIFNAAVDLRAEARARLLAQRCGDDLELRALVERLLANHDSGMGDFLEIRNAPPAPAADPADRADRLVGVTLAHYRIVEKVDGGAMGVVYRAQDERLHRDVAIKVLSPGLVADEVARKRFRNEAVALSQLNHPNIATIHDVGSHDGVDFLVMEMVQGQSLSDQIAGRPLPEREVLRLGEQLLQGLAAAHARGVIHRDLKPGNVRITSDRRLKVLDFGLALLTRPSVDVSTRSALPGPGMAGTLPYMAPELLRGGPPGVLSDIYAAGAVLYEMACGSRAFPQTSESEVIAAILGSEPRAPRARNPSLSPALERVVLKALEKEPTRRYQSAGELAAALDAATRGAHSIPRAVKVAAGVLAVAAVITIVVLAGKSIIPRPVPAGEPSLAVLPFTNLGEAGRDDFLAAGLTEDLTTSLSQVHGLRVVSRSAVERYRGRPVPPRQIGRELRVYYLLEGSARHIGDSLRVTAQLVRAVDGSHVWAGRYDGQLAGIFAVQDSITSMITSALQVTLAPEERAKISRRWTENAQAYAFYLIGREIHFDAARPQHFTDARPWFEKAIALDQDYAPALAGLADALIGEWASGRRPPGTVARAIALAKKAEKLDPLLATAWRAEGRAYMLMTRDLRMARQVLERAIVVNPGMAESHWELARLYELLGQRDQATAMVRRAVEIDPDWPNAYLDGANIYRDYGSYEEADKLLARGLARLPNEPVLLGQRAGILMAQRRYLEATAILRQALKAGPDFWVARAQLANCLHELQRDAEADSVLRGMIQRWPDIPQVLDRAATLQLARGRVDPAESLLVRAVRIDPDFYFARRTLADCYLKSGRAKEAERAYLEIARSWPDVVETRVDVARFYHGLKRYREAEAHAKRAIGLGPQWEGARGQLGWAYLAQGNYESAAQAFREGIELRPDSYWNHRGLAVTLQSAGKIHESLKAAQRAVALKPDYLDGLMALGRAYSFAKDRHRAAEVYERILAIDPTHTGALNNLANIYVEEERFPRALATYRRAAQLDTVGTIYWENIAHLTLIYLRDLPVAQEAAMTCIRRGRGTRAEAAGFHWLGLIEGLRGHGDAAQGHYRKGLDRIEAVLGRNPNDRDAVDLAGHLCARVGEMARARRHANWLARTQREAPDFLYDAGAIMTVAGERDRAFEYLRAAVGAGFDDRGLMSRDVDLDAIRKDPRFTDLLASVP